MTGKLWVGELWAEITSISFSDGVMHIEAHMGPDVWGEVAGKIRVTGEHDNDTVVTGMHDHRYGIKKHGSCWDFELALDIRQLKVTKESLMVREQHG